MFVEQKGRVANLDGGGQSSPAGISSTKVSKQFFFLSLLALRLRHL